MSTTTPTSSPERISRDHGRIRHPLDSLRKYINAYVGVEAIALFGLVVTLAFWLGLWSDFGTFKAFTMDWVQSAPWGFRFVVLVGFLLLLVAFVLFVVLTRFFKEFRDSALALLLERRFPKLLGDRLITAVELHDPKQAASYGYSPALVAETIHEAADRVEKVPVKEVFAWNRLWTYGFVLLYLSVGLYLLTVAGFCAARAGKKQPAMEGVGDFHEVAGIWAERNLLLKNVIWPRRAHLEIMPFDPKRKSDETRIARDQPPPTLRVRAWKYVLADNKADEGWRLLTWADLEANEKLAGGEVAGVPADWTPRDPDAGLTVDEVELRLEAFPVRKKAPSGVEASSGTYLTSDSADSWRDLMWAELTKEKLGGLEVPGIPGEWDAKGKAAMSVSSIGLGGTGIPVVAPMLVGPKVVSLSVDEVKAAAEAAEQALGHETNKEVIKKTTELLADVNAVIARLDRLSELSESLDRIQARAADRSMRRTMRKLTIPQTVTLVYRGRRTVDTVTMTRTGGNEFLGNFRDLKETVSYYVRGEDYITGSKRLVVVELPRIDKLESEEERPGYLYYRPSEQWEPLEVRLSKLGDLRGKRQLFSPIGVSLSGDASTIEVPSGTKVRLTATSSKPLLSVSISADKKDQKALKVKSEDVALLDDQTTFTVEIDDIRREQRFTFDFVDTDEVKGKRMVVIVPREDVAPRIREFNPDEVLRKVKEGYLVSANARIPFKARIRDDHGLSRVRYGCKAIPADFLNDQLKESLNGVAGLTVIGRAESRWMGLAYMMWVHKRMVTVVGDDVGEEQFIDVPAFAQQIEGNRLKDGRAELLEMGTVLTQLSVKQREPFRRLFADFSLLPDKWTSHIDEGDGQDPKTWVRAQDQRVPPECDLPLWKLTHKGSPLKERDEGKPQKRYMVEVRLVAEDTYAEGELDPKTGQPIPHLSPSSETFTLVVVPENELLSRIAEEEETKGRDLLKLVKPLSDGTERMRDIVVELSVPVSRQEIINGMLARCDSLDETLKLAHQDAIGVKNVYERIVREQRLNQVNESLTAKVFRDVTLPLIRMSDVQFDRTIQAVREVRKTLDNQDLPPAGRGKEAYPKAQEARNQLNNLVATLRGILDKMQRITEINALIKDLAEIERQEEKIGNEIKKIRQKQIDDILKGAQ